MPHKKRASSSSSKYASDHHMEKNQVRSLQTYIRRHPKDLQAQKILRQLQEQWAAFL